MLLINISGSSIAAPPWNHDCDQQYLNWRPILIHCCRLNLHGTPLRSGPGRLYFDNLDLNLRVSPGRVGRGHLISQPAPMIPPTIGTLETMRRIVMAAV